MSAIGCDNDALRLTIGKHSFLGLQSRHLLNGGVDAYEHFTPDHTAPELEPAKPWRFCWMTRYGFELFVWGLGLGNVPISSYFDLSPDVVDDLLPPLEVLSIELGRRWVTGKIRGS
jgi:hypothetical protein